MLGGLSDIWIYIWLIHFFTAGMLAISGEAGNMESPGIFSPDLGGLKVPKC